MPKFIGDHIKKINKPILTIPLILGFFLASVFKNPLTNLLFGKDYYGRNFIYRVLFLFFCTLIFSFIILVLFNYLLKINWFAIKANRAKEKVSLIINLFNTNEMLKIFIVFSLMGLGVIIIFLFNNVLSSIDTQTWKFTFPEDVPIYSPIGIDFRLGLYRPAENLFIGKSLTEIWTNSTNTNSYPPLATVIGLFYLPFNENFAYLIHICLLIVANIVCVVLAALISKKYIFSNLQLDNNVSIFIAIFITFIILFFTFSSYPFAFSIERGNIDIYAILFTLLSLWILLRNPDQMWPQVILLSVATNIKIYPAILFILLFKKHGKKMILPMFAANLGFLFILGPNNAIAFIKTIFTSFGVGHVFTWVGNHSSYSFIKNLIDNYFPSALNSFIPLWLIFTVIPLLFWGIATLILFKQEYSPKIAIFYYLISVPIMDILPSVSHDYKLVIISSAVVLLLSSVIEKIIQKPHVEDYFQLIFIFIILFFIGRSSVYFRATDYYLIANKYIWLLFLEGIIFWRVVRISNSDLK